MELSTRTGRYPRLITRHVYLIRRYNRITQTRIMTPWAYYVHKIKIPNLGRIPTVLIGTFHVLLHAIGIGLSLDYD